jgi:hypothetical protein
MLWILSICILAIASTVDAGLTDSSCEVVNITALGICNATVSRKICLPAGVTAENAASVMASIIPASNATDIFTDVKICEKYQNDRCGNITKTAKYCASMNDGYCVVKDTMMAVSSGCTKADECAFTGNRITSRVPCCSLFIDNSPCDDATSNRAYADSMKTAGLCSDDSTCYTINTVVTPITTPAPDSSAASLGFSVLMPGVVAALAISWI